MKLPIAQDNVARTPYSTEDGTQLSMFKHDIPDEDKRFAKSVKSNVLQNGVEINCISDDKSFVQTLANYDEERQNVAKPRFCMNALICTSA